MEYRAYENVNDKIIKTIENNYSKDFHKTMKMFKIIMVGYNASKYKSLQVFKKYGWNLSIISSLAPYAMSCILKNKISSKTSVEIYILKNKKTGIIESPGRGVFFTIKVDETDELFEQIKSLDKIVYFDTYNRFGNDILNYEIISRDEHGNGYTLKVSYPCSL